jgi:hypothetical protein
MTKIRFDKTRLVCTGCGAEVHAACTCGMAYEILAEKREGDRQRAKAYRVRKHEQKQQPRHVTDAPWKDESVIEAEVIQDDPLAEIFDSAEASAAARKAEYSAEEDGPIREVDADEWKAQEKARLKQPLQEEGEDEVTIGDWQNERRRADRLEKRVSDLTEALRAKEKTERRDWPADMQPKQIKKRDDALSAIAFWQRALEKLYNEATGQPAWRVEMTAKDGQRLGNGLRFSTRGEAEFYSSRIAEESDGAEVEILACDGEKGNVSVSGTSVHFEHGDCVLFNWRPVEDQQGGLTP